MELIERNLFEFFGLLIPFLIALILCIYVIKSRFNLIRSVLFSFFNKSHFKNVESNSGEQEFIILLWSSIIMQGIMLHFFFLPITSSFFIYGVLIFLIIIKYLALKFSSVFLEQAEIFRFYTTSFLITIIYIGWICIPTILFNVLYSFRLDNNTINNVNNIFFFMLVLLFTYRFFYLFRAGRKENISYIHIIFYLCTLEILPLGIISSFLVII